MINRKIVITGGTSGIGLEIFKQLKKDNDIHNISRTNGYDLNKEADLRKSLERIKEVNPDILFLNSGIAKFEEFSKATFEDINKIININLSANIFLISKLKAEIKNGLKIVITLSTASYINGAYEAIYNSSKKAMKEYIISVNTELKDQGIDNNIFMFVPHKIEGTKMTSDINNPSDKLKNIIKELIEKMDSEADIYVPSYEQVYKNVFDEYTKDPYEQGRKSIEYKRSKNG